MSSNIYYPERKLIRNSEASCRGIWGKMKSVFELGGQKNWQPEVITAENIRKLISTSSIGMSLKRDIPYHNFSFRYDEIWYDHKELGRVFIPQNIHLTDGQMDFFVVLIDDEWEIRHWPDMRKPDGYPGRYRHCEVTRKETLDAIECSIAGALDFTGVNKG